MKKVLTPLDLLASVVEMKPLVGSRVDNVYKTAAGFLFKLGQGLVAVTKFRVSLTSVMPDKTHLGAETLRGLFRDEKLLEISMPRFDRIVEFKFQSGELVTELVEPFNVVALRNNKVVWLLHSYRGRDRELRAGGVYKYPPAAFIDVLSAGVEEIAKIIDVNNVKKSLVRHLGVGSEMADELIAAAGSEPEALARELKRVVERILHGHLEPSVCVKSGKLVSVLPLKPRFLQCDEVRQFGKFWEALDFYFTPMEVESAVLQASHRLEVERKKLEKTILELESKIPEYRQEAERLRALARELLTYKYEIEEALRGETSRVRIQHVYGKIKIILPGGTSIEMPKDIQLRQYISEMFEEAKKYEEKASKALQVIERLRREISKIAEEEREIEEKVKARVVRKSWFEKFHWTVTTNLKPVIGGRDASQNEIIVRKYLKENYFFIHADVPGASVVVMPPSEDPLEVLQAAQFAAVYSKAWKIGIHSVDVFYVRGDQVSKHPPSGQYLAKGSFMIYGKREYVKNVRLELAVGVRRDGDQIRVVTAPPKSAPLLAERYVVITPGNVEKSKLAKELAEKWNCSVDNVLAALPGASRVSDYGKSTPLSWSEIEKAFEW